MNADVAPDVVFSDVATVFTMLASLKRRPGGDDTLTVGHIKPAEFRAVEKERDSRRERLLLFYQPIDQMLVITVPTAPHEFMHGMIYDDIRDAMAEMGVSREWVSTRSMTLGPPDGSSGEADSAGLPRSSRKGGDWPTLVIEAGFSQTLPSLRVKMRWWFSASSHQVKVVILVKMEIIQERIIVEKWAEESERPGATNTRSITRAGLIALRPVCQQTINIDWTGPERLEHTPRENRTASQYRVTTGGPLVIGFSEIFLRQPTGQEHDITISESRLQDMAAWIWQTV